MQNSRLLAPLGGAEFDELLRSSTSDLGAKDQGEGAFTIVPRHGPWASPLPSGGEDQGEGANAFFRNGECRLK